MRVFSHYRVILHSLRVLQVQVFPGSGLFNLAAYDNICIQVGHYLQNIQAADIYMLECLILAWPVKTICL